MNRYEILDTIRRTSIVDKRDYYLRLFKDPEINKLALNIQRGKLVSFLKRLRDNSFYKDYLEGISDLDIEERPYDVLQSFPFSDKEILTNNYQHIRNPDYKGESCYTGGSTGSPFHYYVGKDQLSSTIGFSMFLWSYLGNYKWNDSTVVVGGASVGDKQSLRNKALHFLQRRTYVSGGEINPVNAEKLAKYINDSNRPVFLYGYPSSICQYLILFEELAISINTDNIKSVLTTSEMLSDERKKVIEDYFHKDVINLYGARDGGISAGSKDNRFFIYNGIDCIAESVEIDGVKELVLTNLDSDAFPFVRYRNGDIASPVISNEGYPFLLTNIQGRTRDFIHLNHTEKVHGSQINKVFKESSVVEYQIVQHEDYRCEIRIQTKNDFTEKELLVLSDRIRQLLRDIPFQFVVVNSIERGKNNKLRNIISMVKE